MLCTKFAKIKSNPFNEHQTHREVCCKCGWNDATIRDPRIQNLLGEQISLAEFSWIIFACGNTFGKEQEISLTPPSMLFTVLVRFIQRVSLVNQAVLSQVDVSKTFSADLE